MKRNKMKWIGLGLSVMLCSGILAANAQALCPTQILQNAGIVSAITEKAGESSCQSKIAGVDFAEIMKGLNISCTDNSNTNILTEDLLSKLQSNTECNSEQLTKLIEELKKSACNKDSVITPPSNEENCTNGNCESQVPDTTLPEQNNENCTSGNCESQVPDTTLPEQNNENCTSGNCESQTPDTTLPEQNNSADYAKEILDLVNQERQKAGLNALELDAALCNAAQTRSQEQTVVFSHTRPNGQSCFSVLDENGISYRGAGENIAMGQRSAEEVMNGWMNSEGHRANILNSSFTKLGVGCYQDSAGKLYWTQLFTY